MFTGLIEEVGQIRGVKSRSGYRELSVGCRTLLQGLKKGDSVAINGACQTVTSVDSSGFTVEALMMTLEKTTSGSLKTGQPVNLERAMAADSRFDGHMVQGHVETVGAIVSIKKDGQNRFLTVKAPKELQSRLIPEGSVTVDGMSLTIAKRQGMTFTVNIIPETWANTILANKKPGDKVNLETDLLLRHNEYKQKTLSLETLREWGYGT